MVQSNVPTYLFELEDMLSSSDALWCEEFKAHALAFCAVVIRLWSARKETILAFIGNADSVPPNISSEMAADLSHIAHDNVRELSALREKIDASIRAAWFRCALARSEPPRQVSNSARVGAHLSTMVEAAIVEANVTVTWAVAIVSDARTGAVAHPASDRSSPVWQARLVRCIHDLQSFERSEITFLRMLSDDRHDNP